VGGIGGEGKKVAERAFGMFVEEMYSDGEVWLSWF
jgi:hypothetical protein